MSALAPASRSTRCEPPPIMIGGPPAWTGLGTASNPWANTPASSIFTSPSAKHARSRSTTASSRSMRVAGARERDAHRLVLAGQPPGAEARLDPPVGQQVEGGQLLGEHDGMVVVDAEDAAADAQRRRRLGGDGHRGHGGDRLHRDGSWPPAPARVRCSGRRGAGLRTRAPRCGGPSPATRRPSPRRRPGPRTGTAAGSCAPAALDDRAPVGDGREVTEPAFVVSPASTTRHWPVTYLASSLAR